MMPPDQSDDLERLRDLRRDTFNAGAVFGAFLMFVVAGLVAYRLGRLVGMAIGAISNAL
jgi:hypothetical protein